ncbi:hypothetical protein OAL53_00350 [Akkermansiaceae bacterium]|jgi:hypothetical protein|nr:hypothetical protein [Verrucomicrobiota bacterium]MDA7504771.1 hypothetical protein [Akkermansiaceae bacterium]MDA7516226.1 hypothetical protein [bacterium]MBT6169075.1 hypothetical protein [Verrucomicrobiota bacterium]MBT7214441.1 hypothetical protein [Verrucomicrobiota bacterium]
MKISVIFAIPTLVFSSLVSCESGPSRRAGGAAFDDSELGRKLDANSHLPDPENASGQSFAEWRQRTR